MKMNFVSDNSLKKDCNKSDIHSLKRLEQAIDYNKLNDLDIPDLMMQGTSLPPDFYKYVDILVKNGVIENAQIMIDLIEPQLEVPLVYKQLYRTIENANFPETMLVKDFTDSDFFFTQHYDGEPVLMNDLKRGGGDSVSLQINAGGWARSKRDEIFGNGYKDQLMRQKAGVGYRHYLNAIYMQPIVSFNGTKAKKTKFDVSCLKDAANLTWFEKNWWIIKAATDQWARLRKEKLWGSVQPVAIMNSVTEIAIKDYAEAIKIADSKRYASLMDLFTSTIIYDGADLMDKDRKVASVGIADNKIILAAPKGNHHIELVRNNLTLITDKGLAANLGSDTNVFWDCRGAISTADDLIEIDVVPLSGGDNSPIILV